MKVNDKLTLQASLVNGWNNDPDINAWKTVGLNATITVNPMVSIIPTVYIGKEAAQPPGASTPGDTRVLVDVVVPVTLSDKIGLNFNVDYINAPNFLPPASRAVHGRQQQLHLRSFGHGPLRAQRARLSGRARRVRAHAPRRWAGATANNNVDGGTVMLGLPMGKNFELRPEVPGRLLGRPDFFARRHEEEPVHGHARRADVLLGFSHPSNRIQARVAGRQRGLFLLTRRRRRRKRSLSTPAAVTAGPAPGPVITSGFLR